MVPLKSAEDSALIQVEKVLIAILAERSKQSLLSQMNLQSTNKKLQKKKLKKKQKQLQEKLQKE